MFSAARVVGLLSYQLGIDPNIASATREESKLAGIFAHLLHEASLDRLVYESKEEATMEDPSDDECADPTWGMEDLDIVNDLPALDRKNFQFSNGFASLETVLEAAAFYRSTVTKPHKNLMAMKSRFRFITNEHDLRKIESFAKDNVENTARRASRVTGLQNLSNHLMEEVTDAFNDGYTIHDFDLTVMALDLNREHCYVSGFEASPSFISRFKRKYRIGSRQTTKFVSRVNHVDEQAIKKSADDFVATIKDEMKMRPLSMFANADQSGFLKEMVSKRSLAPIGQRSVVRCVQSKASLTHSYTILPIVYADGSLGETLYINLQEPKGQFPKTKRIFSAPNIYVTCGTTHIMTKNHMREWVNKCIFTPSSPSSDLVILLDSWSSFSDTASIDASLPAGKTLAVRQIPKGATGICQPLDVYFFRPFKGLVRRIQSFGFKNCPGFVAHQRDTILKVMSLSYSIMCAPAFRPLIQYAWHAAGYLDTPPTSRFKTPVEVCFPRSVFSAHCQYPNCSSKKSFILCPKCNQILCFTCYVIEYHTC